MVKHSRKGLLFGVGLLVGIAAGAVGMMSLRGGDGPYAGSPLPHTRSMGAAPASTAFVTAVAGNCEMSPVLPNGGEGDGHETLQAKPGAASAGEVASLILAGKEAAAAGRNRDAEIDFLNACRNAATLQDGDPVPVSDAMYQLGRHYANVGALGAAPAKAQELFRRAERLYSASLEGFRARYGEDHEKTRFAREGLLTVQQATGGKAPKVIAKAAPAPAAPAASAPAASASAAPAMAAASSPSPATAAASAPQPAPASAVATAPSTATPPPRRPVAKAPPRAPRHEAAAPAPDASRDDTQAAREERRDATPRVQRLPEPEWPAATEEARPRPQARRAPREPVQPDDMAVQEPLPRRMRPAPIYPPPSEVPLPPSDYSSSGAGPATAEGSPNAP